MQNDRITLNAHDTRRVAVAASCDPRSVLAFLDPQRRPKMKSTTAARVGEALAKLGLPPASVAA